MASKPAMLPGRRLRLDRRKAGLSQEGLAEVLGCTLEEVSKMERNVLELTQAAQAFIAVPPAGVPAGPKPRRVLSPAQPLPAEDGLVDAPAPSEAREGLGPRPGVEPGDAPPRPGPARHRDLKPSRNEIDELEAALLTLFAGTSFMVPRTQPDGTVTQHEAVIPGVAQIVGMADHFDGEIIRTYSPGMARAWAELARENPTVRKVLIGLTYGGAYRGVIMATAPALLAIAAHHGLVPLGGGPKRVVEQPAQRAPTIADVDAEIMRLQELRMQVGAAEAAAAAERQQAEAA